MNKYERDDKKNRNDSERLGEIRFTKDRKSRVKNNIILFLSITLLVIVTSLITSLVMSKKMYKDSLPGSTNGDIKSIINKTLEEYESSFYERELLQTIYEDISLSIVGVSNDEDLFFGDLYDNLYSGVVMNKDGYILVPYSVVEKDNQKVFVRDTRDKDNIFEAEVIGKDKPTDTGVIRVKNLIAEPPKFGDSSLTKVAESVISIGNSFGDNKNGTVTYGLISTVNKLISTVTEDNKDIKVYAFETDAVINKGNDGGVLVNLRGEVIGINTYDLTKKFNCGFGTAITSNEARSVVRSIIKTGDAVSPSMGIVGEMIKEGLDSDAGFYIQKIIPESTSDRAGLRPTDIILSIDNKSIDNKMMIDDYLKEKEVGDKVLLKYRRADKEIEEEIILYSLVEPIIEEEKED